MELDFVFKDKIIDSLTDEELELLTSRQEKLWDDILSVKAYSAEVDAIKDLYPKFKNKTLSQLDVDEDFQQALEEYRAKYPPIVPVSDSTIVTSPAKIKEALKSIIPKNYYISNNKLSNEITKDLLNKGTVPLAVINSNKKGEILTYNSLTYDNENISITGQHEFTAYDRAIHNAVCSLYAAGNDIVTPAMVYRAVNGMSEQEKVSPQAMEAVRNSLNKSRFMRLKVNYTEEAKARNIDIAKAEIDSNLLEARVITIEAGGHKVDAYRIHEMPVLYEYAQQTKQIISVPLKLLSTKGATRNTEEIIPIKEYLIRRIEIMKNDKSMSNKILYETIFDEVGIEHPNKKKSFDIRTGIKAILNLWRSKKYIKDFREYKSGNIIKGFEIIY